MSLVRQLSRSITCHLEIPVYLINIKLKIIKKKQTNKMTLNFFPFFSLFTIELIH